MKSKIIICNEFKSVNIKKLRDFIIEEQKHTTAIKT